ncbi:SIS domain-containing protein [Planktomarina temperata]|nr:SIS domain-containing protein [Planktomarina temperata]
MSFTKSYLLECSEVLKGLDAGTIENIVVLLHNVRAKRGRVFFLGVGGSAANCSHAVNDFRKIAGIECYTPSDNVSELTARTNDEGWETVFVEWLKTSRLNENDCVFVFSVGGGNVEKNISPNLVAALLHASEVNCTILGIVGRDGGYTANTAHACVKIPVVNSDHITPHSEAFQAVIWHLIVSHPKLKLKNTKWETSV